MVSQDYVLQVTYPLGALRLAGGLALSLRAVSMRMRPDESFRRTMLRSVEISERWFLGGCN
jgi:small neutral amino acid transporter SnatA (MarC family)